LKVYVVDVDEETTLYFINGVGFLYHLVVQEYYYSLPVGGSVEGNPLRHD